MKIVSLLKLQIYLLQLENYNLVRYFFISIGRFGRTVNTRKEIVWTTKLQLVVVLAAVLALTVDLLVTWTFGWSLIFSVIVYLILAVGLSFLFFVFLIAACVILLPVDFFLKKQLIAKAAAKRAQFPNLKVIAVAGSYGKTTMKEMVASVLSQKYQVLKTSENINTPLGISRMILDKLNAEIDFLIIEVGEYVRGDVREICNLVKPEVGIITGINQAHLERMGSLDNTVAAIFELADNIPSGLMVLNGDDQLVKKNYEHHQHNHQIEFYSSINTAKYKIQSLLFTQKGIDFEVVKDAESLGHFQTSLLADYAAGITMAAIIVGEYFKVPMDQIRTGISLLKPIPHRLQLIPNNNNVTVIDDSYNGNPTGVSEAIKVLSRFSDKRKIYITPGLVEMGADSSAIHYNIGKSLAPVANLVILIKNSVTGEIARGLTENGFKPENLMYYSTAQEAHADLVNVIKPGDAVMFQNDWPENYL